MESVNSPRFRLLNVLALLAAVTLSACARADDATVETPADRGAAASPDVLMQADRDFAAAVQSGGADAWASWFASDGAMIQPGVGEIQGLEAIRRHMASLDSPGVALRWEPVHAEIAASGDLGWTTGRYTSESPGAGGETVRGEGRYVSIWRRQADGQWRVVMDLGNPTGQPPG